MTTPQEITKALGGDWHGSFGLCPGPGHSSDDRSLKVSVGESGKLIVHSFANDDWKECRDWLKAHGYLAGTNNGAAPHRRHARRENQIEAQKRKRALDIWESSLPAAGTVVERYLRDRAIATQIPPSIRFHPGLPHYPTGLLFPAMVAAVQGPSRNIIAIHRTYLRPDGCGKAEVSSPKMALAPLGEGSARLWHAGQTLGICEGIETGISAMQLFGLPVWAALGSRLHRVWVPPCVQRVVIFADSGKPGAENAAKAEDHFRAQRRAVEIRTPPYGDWNDVLQEGYARV